MEASEAAVADMARALLLFGVEENQMSSQAKTLAVIVLATAVPACSHGHPYQTLTPVLAPEGVELEAEAQCSVTGKDHMLDLNVELHVSNPTDAPVLVMRDRFRLAVQTAARPALANPAESGVISVLPEDTLSTSLSFRQPGVIDCEHPLTLDAGDAVQLRGKRVALPPIHLTPGS